MPDVVLDDVKGRDLAGRSCLHCSSDRSFLVPREPEINYEQNGPQVKMWPGKQGIYWQNIK